MTACEWHIVNDVINMKKYRHRASYSKGETVSYSKVKQEFRTLKWKCFFHFKERNSVSAGKILLPCSFTFQKKSICEWQVVNDVINMKKNMVFFHFKVRNSISAGKILLLCSFTFQKQSQMKNLDLVFQIRTYFNTKHVSLICILSLIVNIKVRLSKYTWKILLMKTTIVTKRNTESRKISLPFLPYQNLPQMDFLVHHRECCDVLVHSTLCSLRKDWAHYLR